MKRRFTGISRGMLWNFSDEIFCIWPRNVSIRARVEEILAAGAERAEITVEQVLRELAVLGFSDIGKVVRWRPDTSRTG